MEEMANIFIVSGEESGDLHGSSLMAALKRLMPSLKVGGMGGARMREAGLVGLDSGEVSVVGVVEVIEKLPRILRTFKELKKNLLGFQADAVVLIDFPDFNLKFAREVKRLGIPIIYYISPQVWAWRKGRVAKIARLVDKMLVVFPFEEQLYRDAGVDVEYVGHPLADSARLGLSGAEAKKDLGLPPESLCVALLPGSRTGEIKRLLPSMLKAAWLIEKSLGEKKPLFLLPAANSIDDSLLDGYLKDSPAEVKVVRGKMHTALRASKAAIVASGTATLETALIGTPMVIVYRMSPVSYAIAKALIKLPYAGLPNIIAGREVVRELIQGSATPEKMAEEIISMLRDPGKRDSILDSYSFIRKSLKSGAAANAARAVKEVIEKRGRL
ncbi:MAG: lipid-A-disaccharide synthase [Deltaproteobacteria bacterium]|nr:lipid-A-disaccharide synthase [Deltaproteobacteria bacterium]